MIFTELQLKGAFLVAPQPVEDARGFFARAWCRKEFEANGLNPALVQINIAYNHRKGTVRGMHYQEAPHAEAKLVRCLRGAVFDVLIDLRPDSPTRGRWFGLELTEANRLSLYIPEGCAHGYQTLTDGAEISYQTSAFYAPTSARGVRYDDPAFGIQWPIAVSLVSDADRGWPDYRVVK